MARLCRSNRAVAVGWAKAQARRVSKAGPLVRRAHQINQLGIGLVVGTAHESLHLWQWLCQRLCPPYILVKLPNLKPGRAFELSFGELRRQLRIGAALAGLAIEADAQNDLAGVGGVIHLTALLDEQRADRALAFGRR